MLPDGPEQIDGAGVRIAVPETTFGGLKNKQSAPLGTALTHDTSTGWNTKQSHPVITTLTKEGNVLERKLSRRNEDPVAILRDYITRDQTTVEIVGLCLQEYMNRLGRKSRRERLRLIRHGNIDPALTLFFDVFDGVVRARSQVDRRTETTGRAKTSFWPATVELCGALGQGVILNTNPALYDRFVRLACRNPRQAYVGYLQAVLALNHPSKPTADDALRLLRTRFSDKTGPALRSALPIRTEGSTKIIITTRDTAQTLRRQGHHADAEWVTRLMERLLSVLDQADRDHYERAVAKREAGLRLHHKIHPDREK
ncbi:hypothetical protein LTR36_007852 [Oleoguttula mirabilis]|uniref:Uncharacterized protein n=1 Tax=Oleoguttula mirabilis TaxID=1507867 RepID=A0AAV9J8X7_9PEZI|nr:hypothetical protein LTR36_007852 [Oleoguttula mirabilis]